MNELPLSAILHSATVSAPGKLILMGEHAVVYGRPALIAAVDRRLTATVTPRAGAGADIALDLPAVGLRRELPWAEVLASAGRARAAWERWAADPGSRDFREVRGDDPAHVVAVALGEAARFLGEADGPPLALRVSSDLPVGSGFGSSAATGVAVLAAYLAARGVEPGADELHRLSLEVERRQHGLPSGVDSATVLHGGVLWARRVGAELEVEPLPAASPLLGRLRVFDTGTPLESTGAVVAAVRSRLGREPAVIERLLERLEAATRGLRGQLAREAEEPAAVVDLLAEAQACLEALGVVSQAVAGIARRIEAAGGAAKISGAGALTGAAAGSLLVYHPDPERISSWGFLEPFPLHPVALGAPGYRREVV